MPIFQIDNNRAREIAPMEISLERDVQRLIESNLEEVLDIYFLSTEYSTSFGGRIDTLGIDKNGSPVIIEYKKNQNDNVINQALSYLRWLLDHKAEFEKLVSTKLSNVHKQIDDSFIDWDSPRVICIAPSFNKFDLDTVAVLPINIELIKYRLYQNNILTIDLEATKEIHTDRELNQNHPKSIIKEKRLYTIDFHLDRASPNIRELYNTLREMIMALDDSIVEEPKAKYIAFKLSTNFVDVVVQKEALKLYLNLPKGKLQDEKTMSHDVSNKGHWGNGDYVSYLRGSSELDYIYGLITQSYKYNS